MIDALANDRVVIRPDYMNSKGKDGASYSRTIPEAASQVLKNAAIIDRGPVDLVGYSLGAGVAAFIAAEYPETVRSLVIVSGFGYGSDVWMKLQFTLWLDLIRANHAALTRLLLLTGVSTDFLSRFDEDTIAGIVNAFVTSTDWESLDHSIRLDLGLDVREQSRKISVPTLSITATHDRIVPASHSRQLSEMMAGAQHAAVDAGHLAFLERPSELAMTIEDFLSRVDLAATHLPITTTG
ncbi:putative hydrolase [Acidisarcina polymorpha]|uniref:Putative hydrolase n=1 Tax=Acidisarcina polymorpha TaxID=2211140 RepID=A0A2Z5G4X2_9BACT|nr:putative hydrolase [Acidisarcina polymorpha]